MNKEEEAFYKKINDEYDDFKSRTMQRGAENIFDLAGQISVKADFKGILETTRLNSSELQKLNSVDNLLDRLYLKWLDYDETVGDEMLGCLNDFLAGLGALRLQ